MQTMNARTVANTRVRCSGVAILLLALSALGVSVDASAAYDLQVSQTADKAVSSPLNGQTLGGNVYVYATPDTGIKGVRFYMDDQTMSRPPMSADWAAPFDLTATNPVTPYNTSQLADGPHTLTARISLKTGQVSAVNASFVVDNSQPAPQPVISDNFNDGDALGWTTVNDSAGGSPSWHVVNGEYRQDNDVGFASNTAYHRGTYSYLGASLGLSDYRFQVRLLPHSQGGRDIGVMFRYLDNNNYYRLYFSAADGSTRLEKKVNGVYTTLAKNARGYTADVPLDITIDAKGALVQIGVNEDSKAFGLYDTSLPSGGVALYCRHACGFDNVGLFESSASTSLVIAKPEAHSVAPSASVQVSAVVLNKPSGAAADVRFDLGGSPCGPSSETPAGSGRFVARCQEPSGVHVNDLTAVLWLNGVSSVFRDTNVDIGTSGDSYVALGDSITFGLGDGFAGDNSDSYGWVESTTGYPAPLADVLNQSNPTPSIVLNNGFPGDRSSAILSARIDAVLARHSESNYVLLLIGTNDAGGNISSGKGCTGTCAGTFKGNMLAIIDKIVAAGKTPIVGRVPARFGDSATGAPYVNPRTASRSYLTQNYNRVITSELGLTPFQLGPDFYNVFLSSTVNRFSLYADNLHPNALGYRVMAQLWYNHIMGGSGLPFILNNICVRPTGGTCDNPLLYKQNLIAKGGRYYADEGYTITGNVPAALNGAVWVMTENTDKIASASNYLSFTFGGTATIFIAYDDDDGLLDKPTWLTSQYVDTGLVLNTSNPAAPRMKVFRRNNVAGTVTLGGNRAAGSSGTPENYVVVVKPN